MGRRPRIQATVRSTANRPCDLERLFKEESSPKVDEMQDPELLKDFIEEAKEHLSTIEMNMLGLETNPERHSRR